MAPRRAVLFFSVFKVSEVNLRQNVEAGKNILYCYVQFASNFQRGLEKSLNKKSKIYLFTHLLKNEVMIYFVPEIILSCMDFKSKCGACS